MEVYICAIIACDKRGFFVINTMFIFRYFSNDVLLVSVSTRVIVCIQLFREKLSEKVHRTITKGIVGGLSSFERMAQEAVDVCLRVLKESNKRSFDSYSVL